MQVKDHQQTKWGPRLKLTSLVSLVVVDTRHRRAMTTQPGHCGKLGRGCAMQVAGDPSHPQYDQMLLQCARIALKARDILKKEVEV